VSQQPEDRAHYGARRRCLRPAGSLVLLGLAGWSNGVCGVPRGA